MKNSQGVKSLTRKLMTVHKVLYPRDDLDRSSGTRKEKK